MDRVRGVFGCALVGACSLFVFGGTLSAQEAIDVAPARREILEALQRALQPSYDQPAYDQPSNRPLALPDYPEAPPLAPVDIDVEGANAPVEQPLARIDYEVTIVHLAAPGDFQENETTVSSDTIADLLAAWREAGRIARKSTFRFSSVEEQSASLQIGEQVPVATGRATFGGRGGPSQTSVSYHEVGTMVGCTGRLDESDIVVEVQVEESRLEQATAAVRPSVADPGSATGEFAAQAPSDDLQLHSTQQLNFRTTTVVPDGGTVVLSAAFRKTEDGAKGVVVTLKAAVAP